MREKKTAAGQREREKWRERQRDCKIDGEREIAKIKCTVIDREMSARDRGNEIEEERENESSRQREMRRERESESYGQRQIKETRANERKKKAIATRRKGSNA